MDELTDHPRAALRAVPNFGTCSQRTLDRIVQLTDDLLVAPATCLLRQGVPSRQAFIVVRGWATATRNGLTVACAGPGEVIGDLVLMTGAPARATIATATTMRLLVMGPAAYRELVALDPVAGALRRHLAGYLHSCDGCW